MRDLYAIMHECILEMKEANIPVHDVGIEKIETADLYHLGLCRANCYYKKYSIFIRKDLANDNCPLQILKEVIIHELIHTCPRCLGHGKTFVKYAKIMDDMYGYSLLTVRDNDSIYHPEKPILHHYECPNCGFTYDNRNEDSDEEDGYYICNYCRSPLKKVF